jgi:hypothetical protein
MRTTIVFVVTFAACAPKLAPRPTFSAEASAEERQRAYGDWSLRHAGWEALERKDGKWNVDQLRDVLGEDEPSKQAAAKVRRRRLVVMMLAGIGGGLAGATLGTNLAAPEEERWSTGLQVGMYATAGGLVILAIVLQGTWVASAAGEVAVTYNESLRRRLSLPPEPRASGGAPAVVGVGHLWRF